MGVRKELDDLLLYRNAYALALSASMGSIFYGWDVGLIGGILSLPSFQDYFGVNHMSASAAANLNGNIVSILQAGCFFGAIFTGYFSGRFGRKLPLIVSGVIYIIGSIIQTIAGLGSSQSVGLSVLYFGRFVGGFGLGMSTALIPSYVSECTPKAIRGRCTGCIQFSNNIGIMLSFWVNYSSALHVPFGQAQWRMPFGIQIVPGLLFIIFMLPQPESPRWLVEQGRYDEAARALAFAARKSVDDEGVLLTLDEIKADLAGKEKTSILKQFRMMGESGVTALRCLTPSIVMFFQQWTGTNAINYFSPQIFAGLGITGVNAGLFATGVYGVVKVVSVGTTLLFAVEGMGRKLCLIIGGLGQGLMMLWIGGYSAVHPQTTVVPASYVSIVAVYLYAVFYCIGWGPVPWVVAGEVAPNHVRTAAMSVALSVNWLFSFTISRLTPVMLEKITYGTFLLFGFCCVIMAAWAYFFLPETKGYALEDIKFLFETDLVVRSLEDAPGGRIFLGGRRSTPVADLRRAIDEEAGGRSQASDEKATEEQVEDARVITSKTCS
ncbi:general substrate transporter [Phlebopus sp. FC_14]|nr:general substrate transporter [Phlebopus sp. FC_14]